MLTGVDLPPAVVSAAARHTGEVQSTEALGGLSGRTVAAVRGNRASVVVKGPVSRVEVAAATDLAEPLARSGVRTPRTLAVTDAPGGTWLVTEHLPRALPRERWGADAHVIETLRGLHSLRPDLVEHLPDRYRPEWDPSLTAAACSALDVDDAAAARLADLAERAGSLFIPDRVISGDANPLNWRLDDHDRPVLVDWERITVASPAIDLATVIPGLPDRRTADAVVTAYGDDMLTADEIMLAKAWTVIELAATAAPGSAARGVIGQIRSSFLDWLRTADGEPPTA
jgi:aminoglycoside phosphotransferase (APT) family kinase protein